MAKEKEGSVTDNARVDTKDTKDARKDNESVNTRFVADDEATVVLEEPVTIEAPVVPEDIVEQGVTDVDPEKGLVPNSQVPVFTPGVFAPVSSMALPNAQRDAQLVLAAEQDVDGDGLPDKRSLRLDPDARGPRDARDLAILLRQYPHWVNTLDQLEQLEKTEGGVPKPDAWVANPIDLLAEAHKFNMFFIGTNGNFTDRPNQ